MPGTSAHAGADVVHAAFSLHSNAGCPTARLITVGGHTRPSCVQEFGAFLEALTPLLGRLSYAFSRLVLVCEGTPGFQAQVLHGCKVAPLEGTVRAHHLNCGHATSNSRLYMTRGCGPSCRFCAALSGCSLWGGSAGCACSATPPPAPRPRRLSSAAWPAPGWSSGAAQTLGCTMRWRSSPQRRSPF